MARTVVFPSQRSTVLRSSVVGEMNGGVRGFMKELDALANLAFQLFACVSLAVPLRPRKLSLDVHERRFPGGQMQLEAKLLRAETLLRQGRERESLALLDIMYLPGLPRGRELQTVRGELRVKYGRCTKGRRDLDCVLAKDGADALVRRAVRAISLCP